MKTSTAVNRSAHAKAKVIASTLKIFTRLWNMVPNIVFVGFISRFLTRVKRIQQGEMKTTK